jgi:hypothetical protein
LTRTFEKSDFAAELEEPFLEVIMPTIAVFFKSLPVAKGLSGFHGEVLHGYLMLRGADRTVWDVITSLKMFWHGRTVQP